jgi:biotin carboxyl carrier protein
VNWVDTELDLTVLDSALDDGALDGSALDDGGRPVESEGTPAAPAGPGAKAAAWRPRRGIPSITTWSPPGAVPGTGAQDDAAAQDGVIREPSARPGPAPARHAPQAGRWPGHAAGNSAGQIRAPMPGTIVATLVGVGDQVLPTDGICVIEAMKMENVVQAGLAGAVAELRVSPGETVDSGALIAVIRQ